MAVKVVVDAQFGDEGKGKMVICHCVIVLC